MSRMVEHMKHIRKVGGIGCLGLGSDFDGISCELEMENAGQLGKLAREMERAGFTDRGDGGSVFGKCAAGVSGGAGVRKCAVPSSRGIWSGGYLLARADARARSIG